MRYGILHGSNASGMNTSVICLATENDLVSHGFHMKLEAYIGTVAIQHRYVICPCVHEPLNATSPSTLEHQLSA